LTVWSNCWNTLLHSNDFLCGESKYGQNDFSAGDTSATAARIMNNKPKLFPFPLVFGISLMLFAAIFQRDEHLPFFLELPYIVCDIVFIPFNKFNRLAYGVQGHPIHGPVRSDSTTSAQLGIIGFMICLCFIDAWLTPDKSQQQIDEEAERAKEKLERMFFQEHGFFPDDPQHKKMQSKKLTLDDLFTEDAQPAKKIPFHAFTANQNIRTGFRAACAGMAMWLLDLPPVDWLTSLIFLLSLCFVLVLCNISNIIRMSNQSIHSGFRVLCVFITFILMNTLFNNLVSISFIMILVLFLMLYGFIKFMQGLMELL